MLETVSAELLAYQEDRLDSYRELNQTTKPGGIVFAGDSIIEFYPLKKYLGRSLPIHNRGIAGIDSQWLLNHIDEHICQLYPEKVFLLIGTNDIGLGYSNSEIKTRVSEIIAKIQSKNENCNIYLLSVLPVSDNPNYQNTVNVRDNKGIDELNDALKTIPTINYIDLASSLKDNTNGLADGFTKDGLHLNLKGYERISNCLLNYL